MKDIRVVISGGRDFDDYDIFCLHISKILRQFFYKDIEIVSGGCSVGKTTFIRDNGTRVCGVDGMAERFAKERNLPFKLFEADWKKEGRIAGPIRNELMARYSTHSICFWDGKSKGTSDMIRRSEHNLLKNKIVSI